MIATLTLNPAIDKSSEIEKLIPEKKMRCAELQVDAGGGGINVSKAIHELGEESIAIFPCGGVNGDLLKKVLNKNNIKNITIPISGNTRESFAIDEINAGKQFRFVFPGPELSVADQTAIKKTIAELNNISYLVCSGSLPPGVNSNFIGEIASIAKKKHIKMVVDISGPALKNVLDEGVFMLKPNMTELCTLANMDHIDTMEIDLVADKIISSGKCEILVISMGAGGALLITKTIKKRVIAPLVKKISTVGAGDSMVAGIVWMIEKGESPEKAVQFGVACGSAATINRGTRLFKKEDAFRFYQWIEKQSSL